MSRVLHVVLLVGLFVGHLVLGSGCSGEGPHFGRPGLRATGAFVPAGGAEGDARVELLADNPTEAPLWVRRLDVTLSADGEDLARGVWEGSREIASGTAVLLDIALPVVEGAAMPAVETTGSVRVETRFARSGILGLMGGEGHTYELGVRIKPEKD